MKRRVVLLSLFRRNGWLVAETGFACLQATGGCAGARVEARAAIIRCRCRSSICC